MKYVATESSKFKQTKKYIVFVVPIEVKLLKREYFNRWYRLNPHYFAMTLAKLPVQLTFALLYLTMVYVITAQPLEFKRIALFYTISLLVFLTSESMGLLIASRLNVVVRYYFCEI